ncbi:MAG: zinc-binding alcohol dehydrogenase family protein [Acidobacteriia bacterium]|nr:zinc-binding alcohol dehydrogenase family protein [Terriglobia bacterium]
MNAAVLHALGKPPRFESFPEPSAGEGEVIVNVRAAALKPVDKAMARGEHYASFRELPVVCGLDGAGRLEDGSRVVFAGPRRPHGAMAQRTAVARARCFPIPDGVDDDSAAALLNPGMSAWFALTWRAQLAKGETVLILGATGVTGKLAVQIAKLHGAGRVVAAGRNEPVLSTLGSLGADATIRLDTPDQDLTAVFVREAGAIGFDVVIDFLWGHPTEVLLATLGRADFAAARSRVRLVEVGESAGPAISLPAAVLRSTKLEILGSGSGAVPPLDTIVDSYHQMMSYAASGELRVDTERVSLAGIEAAWERQHLQGRRLVVIP